MNEIKKITEIIENASKKYASQPQKKNKNAYNKPLEDISVEFYKENLDFPLSGGDFFSSTNKQTIKRVLSTLTKYVGKKTNIIINKKDANKIFISNFIYFCKLEEIDYTQILEIEVIQNGNIFQIIVNKGTYEDVQIFGID